MLKYGSDKPDLRNPLDIADVTEIFRDSGFGIFAKAVAAGAVVRAIPAPGDRRRPRSFFDKLNEWAREQGAAGLGYVIFAEGGGKGPIAKNLDAERIRRSPRRPALKDGDSLFFVCDKKDAAAKFAGTVRTQARPGAGADRREASSSSAGSSISPCTNATRSPTRSSSATIPSPCPRAGWKRWRRGTR